MKLQYKILAFFPFYLFYFPTVRLGGIPVRFEDLLCLILFVNIFFISKTKIIIDQIKYALMYLIMLACLLASSLYYSEFLNLKGLIVGFSYIKYIMWFFIVYNLKSITTDKDFWYYFFSALKLCFFLQIFILIFQKFDVLGFASGYAFYFVVKFYSIPNIYSTSSDLSSLISTHMNFLFRPAGTFGSSTVTGLAMYIIGSILHSSSGNRIYKFLAYFSALICFAKIAIVTAVFCDFILPHILRFRFRKLMLSILLLPILFAFFYVAMDLLGVLHNFQGAISGTDRGVTHRVNVVMYMLNMTTYEFLFGNLGILPFGFFDSGTLLSIFRYGIIFYILEYLILLMFILRLTNKKYLSYGFIFYIFFADLTFGSIFNPIFSSVIFLILMSSSYFSLKHERVTH